ncbi:MAG: hypothetical protein JW818_14855 [Pirellulales bacterium]|nr:hypothetical protein [Pirellulales bacterium]
MWKAIPKRSATLLVFALFLTSQAISVHAAVVATGDVDPDDPIHNWTSVTEARIGYGTGGAGSISVTEGDAIVSGMGYLGYDDDSTGEVTVDGEGSSWTNTTEIRVGGGYWDQGGYWGHGGNGTLNITHGGMVDSAYGCLGYWYDSTGEVTVDGEGSAWTNSDELRVGYRGSGVLRITHGGMVSNSHVSIGYFSGATGKVAVDGEGSTWTNSGNLDIGGLDYAPGGSGTLTITNGGMVSHDRSFIASGSNSTGEVTVDGEGSTWTNSVYLFVGRKGAGKLNITHGGMVSNGEGHIGDGFNSTGEATVDGDGSSWINSGHLYVGNYSNGTLHITHGGMVSDAYGTIGYDSESSGEVTVDGEGSTWKNIGGLRVGDEGSGVLNILNGGLVIVDGFLFTDYDENGDGFIHMANGGMLALWGETDGSLEAFWTLVQGTDAIQWWDPAVGDWNSLTTATLGEDYSLEYRTAGDLSGYTLLTVHAPASVVPEPSALVSLLTLPVAGLVLTRKRQR